MTVFTENLRRTADFMAQASGVDPIWLRQAADEIESLRTQLASARKALEIILEANDDFRKGLPDDWEGDPMQDACNNARAALKEIKKFIVRG